MSRWLRKVWKLAVAYEPSIRDDLAPQLSLKWITRKESCGITSRIEMVALHEQKKSWATLPEGRLFHTIRSSLYCTTLWIQHPDSEKTLVTGVTFTITVQMSTCHSSQRWQVTTANKLQKRLPQYRLNHTHPWNDHPRTCTVC